MQHEGDTLDIAELPPEVIGARHGLRHQRGVEVAAEGMDSLGGVGYKSPVEDVTVDGDTGEHCGAAREARLDVHSVWSALMHHRCEHAV